MTNSTYNANAAAFMLRNAEELFRSLFASCADGVVYLTTDGRIVDANPAFCDMTGYTLQELRALRYSEFTPSQWHAMEERIVQEQLLPNGFAPPYEKEYLRKDGVVIQVQVKAWTLQGEAGEVVGLWGLVRDISGIRQTEGDMRRLLGLQSAILDSANYSIITTDCDGIITSFNLGAQRMLGYTEEEVIGKHTPAIFHDPREVAKYSEELHEKLGSRFSPGFEVFVAWTKLRHQPDERDWTYIARNGAKIPVRLSVTALLDGEGNVFGYMGIAHDMSERIVMEQALRESEENLRRAQAVAKIGSWQIDMHSGNVIWSDETYRMFEVPHGAPVSYALFLTRVHPEDQQLVDDAWQQAQAGAPYDLEHRLLLTDGTVRWVRERAEPVRQEAVVQAWVGTVQDITDAKLVVLEQQRLLEVLESSPDIVSQADAQGNLLYMNRAGRLLLAWPEDARVEDFSIQDMHPPEVGSHILSEYLPQVVQHGSAVFETRFLTRDGRELATSQLILAHHDAHGKITHYSTVARDMSEQSDLMRRMFLSDKVFTFTNEAIMITDAENRIVQINHAFTQLTGYTAEEVYGQNPRILASGKHDTSFYEDMWHALLEEGHWHGEVWDKRKDGSIYPKWVNINCIVDPNTHQVVNFVALFSDISERKQQEDHIRRLAFHDPLTGLPNRLLFQDRLVQALAEARRDDHLVALMFLDLDRFKDVNDTLGHHVGDLMLREVSARIQQSVREIDTVARLGGDEFVVILTRIRDSRDPAPVAEKILEAISSRMTLAGTEVFANSSIGIALYPNDASSAEELMKSADAALYHAKDKGRGNFQFFTAELNRAAHERVRLDHALRSALERAEFELHYQPKIDLASRKVVGCEALLRWRHPHWGMVSPAEFIPVAEETGMILPIGAWVLREAAWQAADWARKGYPVRIAVNLSARQFADPTLVQSLAALLEQQQLPAHALELEITESTMMDGVAHAAQILRDIKDMGVSLAIDDFGTGYSSLAYLKTFDIDKLKIDQSFIRDIHSDPNDAAIVRALVVLSHELGLEVVAEGVEDEAQLDFLQALGCDIAQGYYFSKPLPAAAFLEFVRQHPCN